MSDGYINGQVKNHIKSLEEAQERVREQERQREAERVAAVQRAEQQAREKIRQEQEHNAKMKQLDKVVSASIQETHKRLHAYFNELASNLDIYCWHKVKNKGTRNETHTYRLQDRFFKFESNPPLEFFLEANSNKDAPEHEISIGALDHRFLKPLQEKWPGRYEEDYLCSFYVPYKIPEPNPQEEEKRGEWPLMTGESDRYSTFCTCYEASGKHDHLSYSAHAAIIYRSPADDKFFNRCLADWLMSTSEKNSGVRERMSLATIKDFPSFSKSREKITDRYKPGPWIYSGRTTIIRNP